MLDSPLANLNFVLWVRKNVEFAWPIRYPWILNNTRLWWYDFGQMRNIWRLSNLVGLSILVENNLQSQLRLFSSMTSVNLALSCVDMISNPSHLGLADAGLAINETVYRPVQLYTHV